jgi:predicted RNA methylase
MAGNRSQLGFYETPKWLSERIATEIRAGEKSQVLDLGAGSGSLSKALKAKNSKIFCSGFEVDRQYRQVLKGILDSVNTLDIFSSPIPKNCIKSDRKTFIVSNPPFGQLRLNDRTRSLLEKFELIDPNSKAVTSRKEIIFLARALAVSRPNTEIVFILPASFLNNRQWAYLRSTLVTTHKLSKVLIAPPSSFKSTEVDCIVFFMKAFAGATPNISIEHIEKPISKARLVNVEAFVDGRTGTKETYYQNNISHLVDHISRGKSCSKELKTKKIAHLHSGDVRKLHKEKVCLSSVPVRESTNERVARSGDILIARVGSRCVGRAMYLKSGEVVISDSIISLRVPKNKQKKIFNLIISDKGQDWIKRAAKGACAKIITYDIIHRFPMGFS